MTEPTHCDECTDGWHLHRAIGSLAPGDQFEANGHVMLRVSQIHDGTVTIDAFYRCPVVDAKGVAARKFLAQIATEYG